MNGSKQEIQKSLRIHLLVSFNRSICLIMGPEIKAFLNRISKQFQNRDYLGYMNISESSQYYDSVFRSRVMFCNPHMQNFDMLPLKIDISPNSEYNDDKTRLLFRMDSYFDNPIDQAPNPNTHYYPFMISPLDLSLNEYISSTEDTQGKKNSLMSIKEMQVEYEVFNRISDPFDENIKSLDLSEVLLSTHTSNRRNISESTNAFAIKIEDYPAGPDRKELRRIAIANVVLYKSDFENSLKLRPNRSLKRYLELAGIVNEAIKNNADVLVLPELYVPFEWLRCQRYHRGCLETGASARG